MALENLQRDAERWIAAVAGDGSVSGVAAQRVRALVASAYYAGRAESAQAPEGWKLVPTEPTEVMIDAMVAAWDEHAWGVRERRDIELTVRAFYAALLAAGPKPGVEE
jgi:hypothetical protein